MASQLRAIFSPAHPLADIFHPPYPPIASQSISRDVPLARASTFKFSTPLFRGVAEAALYCAHRTIIYIDPSQLASFFLEGHPCWSTCGRRTRPFSGRAFREHRTNVGVLPILFTVRVLRARRAPGRSPLSAPGARDQHRHRSKCWSCVDGARIRRGRSCGRGRRSFFGGGLFQD
jgi:hypothetical protein